MKYMLMFCGSDEENARMEAMSAEDRDQTMAAVMGWLKEHRAISFARLQPPATATTVRFNDAGAALVTDGPFIEAKESVGGFAVVEAEDLDQALRIAKSWPPRGIVEVRPVLEPPQR